MSRRRCCCGSSSGPCAVSDYCPGTCTACNPMTVDMSGLTVGTVPSDWDNLPGCTNGFTSLSDLVNYLNSTSFAAEACSPVTIPGPTFPFATVGSYCSWSFSFDCKGNTGNCSSGFGCPSSGGVVCVITSPFLYPPCASFLYSNQGTCGTYSGTVPAGKWLFHILVSVYFWSSADDLIHAEELVFQYEFSSPPDCSSFSDLTLSLASQLQCQCASFCITPSSEPVMIDGSSATLSVSC